MRYYVAKGPIDALGYKWDVSYYKMRSDREADIIRIKDDIITVNHNPYLNPIYVSKYCEEITKEAYESILGL
jgi:hypothetical protein